MQAWQFNLSYTDTALLFLHTMGFVRDKENQLMFGDLLDYYGRSSIPSEIHQESRGELQATYRFCEAYELITTVLLKEKRIFSTADIKIEVRNLDEVRCFSQSPKSYELKYAQWSRKYRCNELGSVELCAEQVSQLVRILSELREKFRNWDYFMHEY